MSQYDTQGWQSSAEPGRQPGGGVAVAELEVGLWVHLTSDSMLVPAGHGVWRLALVPPLTCPNNEVNLGWEIGGNYFV